MRLEQIDLNLFVVFDAIYSERNLTRVSERLSVTQPAISNALARLRHSLNDQLFVRTPKGMKPTPLAETIVEPVRQALHLLNTGIQLSGLFDPAHSKRTFKLSVSRGVESRVLLPLMEYLQHHAPNVAISSYDINRADLPLELSSGTVDLAVNVPLIRDPNLNSVLIAGDPYVCLMRDNHPDAGCNLSFERYLALDHVHISSRRSGAGYVDTKLAQLGAQRRIKFRTSNYELAADIARTSDLIVTLPERMVSMSGLKAFKLPFDLEAQDLCLYWHKSADGDQANRWLRQAIETAMSN